MIDLAEPVLKLALPAKGRMMQQVFQWFQDHGMPIVRADQNSRDYTCRITFTDPNLAHPMHNFIAYLQPVMLNAAEIPRALNCGQVHFGITGRDLLYENNGGGSTDTIQEIARLGFGCADLVIAVPACWYDVRTLDDFDIVAGEFRRQHRFRLRIATKYYHIVRWFLKHNDIADCQLITSEGATEGAVKAKMAEAIADIVSTGKTLRNNHLRALHDPVIMHSEAVMLQSTAAVFKSNRKTRAVCQAFQNWVVSCNNTKQTKDTN